MQHPSNRTNDLLLKKARLSINFGHISVIGIDFRRCQFPEVQIVIMDDLDWISVLMKVLQYLNFHVRIQIINSIANRRTLYFPVPRTYANDFYLAVKYGNKMVGQRLHHNSTIIVINIERYSHLCKQETGQQGPKSTQSSPQKFRPIIVAAGISLAVFLAEHNRQDFARRTQDRQDLPGLPRPAAISFTSEKFQVARRLHKCFRVCGTFRNRFVRFTALSLVGLEATIHSLVRHLQSSIV